MAIQIKANLDGLSGAIQVNGNDAITFDNDGNVVITGTLTASGGGISEVVNGDLTVTGGISTYYINNTANISTNSISVSDQISAQYLGCLSINTNNILVSGDVTAVNFNSTSDARLKSDVQEIDGISLVHKLRPVAFKWQNGEQSYGVMAQEIREVFPSLVSEDKDGYLSVNYIPMIAMLVDAVQKLSADVELLKNQ